MALEKKGKSGKYYYCECGHKLKYMHYERDPQTVNEYEQRNQDYHHLNNCQTHLEIHAREEREKTKQTFKEEGCLKLAAGVLSIGGGLITAIVGMLIGSDKVAIAGFCIILLGFVLAIGISGIIGCIFGGIGEGMAQSVGMSDLANTIVHTQSKVELKNNLMGKDIFGQRK